MVELKLPPIKREIKHILFIIPPGAHLLDVTGPAHVFYEAREYGAEIELHFVSMNDQAEIKCSAGLSFSKLVPFHQFELSQNDFVFIPGSEFHLYSDQDFLSDSKIFLKWLKRQSHNRVNICSVCTGAFLVAESGILDGKTCTTHWKYYAEFSKKYPEVRFEKKRLFVVNDHIYSSAGVSSGIDLALYIIEEHFGIKLAVDVAKEVVIYFRRSTFDPQLSIFLQYRNHLDTRIHEAQDYIAQHLSASVTTDELAKEVNMSPRNLTRLFKKTTGITVGAYLSKLRIERAVHLLAEGHKVNYVANQCGLKSANQLRALLKKYKGILPAEVSSLC